MPFQPGQSGNPGGRTKGGKNLATELADLGKRRPGKRETPAYFSKMPRTRQLAYMLWRMALAEAGNLDAAKYVTDRLLGRPAQELRIDAQQPALVFQIIDPRLPVPDAQLPAPEPQQEAVEGEGHLIGGGGTVDVEAAMRDLDHQAPDSTE